MEGIQNLGILRILGFQQGLIGFILLDVIRLLKEETSYQMSIILVFPLKPIPFITQQFQFT